MSVRLSGRERVEHLLHTSDFRSLVDLNVGSELENEFVLRCSVGREEFVHHGHGTVVVLDHVGQEESVVLRPLRSTELVELLRGRLRELRPEPGRKRRSPRTPRAGARRPR